mmetsp:Transcript_12235/g.13332  ORF Transcript_12235/g.13332 Transcript_12235/m.13332 type:complete len:84 (+) Transcript_12235:2-253(+)
MEGEDGQGEDAMEPAEATDFTVTVENKAGQGLIFYCSTAADDDDRLADLVATDNRLQLREPPHIFPLLLIKCSSIDEITDCIS